MGLLLPWLYLFGLRSFTFQHGEHLSSTLYPSYTQFNHRVPVIYIRVVESLVRSLECESSLRRRVDLFFLVDSIAQCSRGSKGDVGAVYPSAMEPFLPRLLSAVAPPGNTPHENRRQCLKASVKAVVGAKNPTRIHHSPTHQGSELI
ncbi:hypothetical protein TSUD_333010 [Trifolium subterraneum]|uniref:CID domain-containing protein n=1 Tax=Trifolium subterraneum TaxID=3900 RepID=A0A2Z6N6K9_TRISU|nr:hypothetical protein TSUD_333010 [Trifolium subterraneum]